jgi:hypothetical protein
MWESFNPTILKRDCCSVFDWPKYAPWYWLRGVGCGEVTCQKFTVNSLFRQITVKISVKKTVIFFVLIKPRVNTGDLGTGGEITVK